MAAGFLDNLLTSLGGAKEGPDPARLEGLLECARSGMAPDELKKPINRMRSRLQQALGEREASVAPLLDQLHPGLRAVVESNLTACQDLIDLLADFSPANFDAYEEAAQEFLETSRTLAEWNSPMCPRCGSAGKDLCPSCKVERLIPDLEGAPLEFEQGPVSPEVAAVHRAYSEVISGKTSLPDLLQSLQDLEFSLLEAQALTEQARGDSQQEALLAQVNLALEAVNRMHAVEQNRQARELNQGWAQLFRAAIAIQRLLS